MMRVHIANLEDDDEDEDGYHIPHENQDKFMRRVSKGRRRLHRLRCGFAFVAMILSIVMAIVYEEFHQRLLNLTLDTPCTSGVQSHVVWSVHEMCLYGRVVLLSLAPLAGDVCFSRLVLSLDVVVLLTAVEPLWYPREVSFTLHGVRRAVLYYEILINALCILGLLRALMFRDALRMQETMWKVLQMWLFASLVAGVVWSVVTFRICGSITGDVWIVPVQLVTLAFICSRDLRESVQQNMAQLFETHSSSNAAAGIAALVGGRSTKQLMQQSSCRFRGVSLADVSYADIADNAPRPELFERTRALKLNECDAFISHSWHDPPEAKWEALQRWRTAFVREHRREPLVWFDKFCIDQNNIDESLCCLPLFLSGCRRLIVFCGPTYVRRLWCVMELFTYVHIGRDEEHIEFHFVDGSRSCERELIEATFDAFDAAECECFRPEDKDKMLVIIRAAFGSMSRFNRAVIDVFTRVGLREASGADAAYDSDSESSSDCSDIGLGYLGTP
eukprot:TRINITY_DN40169_c0_g1_i1.p1 TRINITY_DN40169_c0_g1~~TRINITY_DN40169_c0_g1_i1.p1  ORF type:complete len:503 (+),score=89.97 TRINITY_DN40169_c0_g1_i1:213-1721(+)